MSRAFELGRTWVTGGVDRQSCMELVFVIYIYRVVFLHAVCLVVCSDFFKNVSIGMSVCVLSGVCV